MNGCLRACPLQPVLGAGPLARPLILRGANNEGHRYADGDTRARTPDSRSDAGPERDAEDKVFSHITLLGKGAVPNGKVQGQAASLN